ncbi:MAG: chloride channel protein [Thermoanaerobaculia bacterium]
MTSRPQGWGARWRVWARWVELVLARRFALSTREDRVFFLLIPTVGLVGGLVAIAVQRASEWTRVLLWGYWPSFAEAARHIPAWRVVAAVTAGGVAVAAIRRAARGPVRWGVGATLEAVMLRGGRLPLALVAWSALAAVATVGSGGSLGREGPMLALSGAIASWLGQRFRLGSHRLKILVGCGTAAGFAAAYNVPIGGSLFAMEVILGSFALEIFGPIVVSALLATLLARAAESAAPIYPAPGYALTSPWEIGAYFGLGLVGAIAAVAFVRGVAGLEGLARRVRVLPAWSQAVLGMALVGGIAAIEPRVCGNGFDTITDALREQLSFRLLLEIALLKWIATGLTTASGSPGGHFTPSLCFGALVGGAYGQAVHAAFPSATSSGGAYAAVGMAAVAAASSQAPLSATLMLFEFTGNYDLILPLMATTLVASLVARRIHPWSIYTERLRRLGVKLPGRREDMLLAALKAGDLAREDPEILLPDTPYAAIVERFLATRRHRLFVVDPSRRLLGCVSLHDIKHALADSEHLSTVVAHDLTAPVPARLQRGDNLKEASEAFALTDFERLPVVEEDGRTFVGVLAKRDLLALYAQEVLGRPQVLSTFVDSEQHESAERLELPPDFSIRSLAVPPALAGVALGEARLTQRLGVRVLELKRSAPEGVEWIMPEAKTILAAGDELVVLGPSAGLAALAAGRLSAAKGAEGD